MLGPPMDENRTEAPTPRRRAQARGEGRVARSPQLSFAAALLALAAVASYAGVRGLDLLRSAFSLSLDAVRDGGSPLAAVRACAWVGAQVLAPALLAVFAAVLLVGLAQVGPMFSAAAVAPRPQRFGERLRALFSPAGLGEAAWSAFAAIVLAFVSGLVWLAAWPGLLDFARRTPAGAAAAFGGGLLALVVWMGATLALFGLADLVLRRLRLLRALRMTRSEWLRESRETEGDPHVRAARRRAHDDIVRGGGATSDASAVGRSSGTR